MPIDLQSANEFDVSPKKGTTLCLFCFLWGRSLISVIFSQLFDIIGGNIYLYKGKTPVKRVYKANLL